MKTTTLAVANLCVPCHAHCRYCLLNSCGKADGVPYERGKAFAGRLYSELLEKRPDIGFYYYIGYCMDDKNLSDYIRFSKELNGPSARFLQLNGLRIRDRDETAEFMAALAGEGIETIDLTFYGEADYHDRFAGRTGDFAFLMRILEEAKRVGIIPHISMPIHKENMLQVDRLMKEFEDRQMEDLSVFLPHGKGRGQSLHQLRLTAEDRCKLSRPLQERLRANRSEAEWLNSISSEKPERRVLTLVLNPEEMQRLEAMPAEEILCFMEELDDRYHSLMPSAESLAARYGSPSGNRLYRRFRDLKLEWEQRYIREEGLNLWDMNDESHHFSVHI